MLKSFWFKMVRDGMKVSILGILVFFIILSTSLISAASYTYNQKIPIINNGEQIGYVKPHQKNVLGINYAYLEWQRYGFPVGDSFPIFLIEGTTTALPFGIEGEFLKVKIGKITSYNVDLVIDQSTISKEAEDIAEEIDESINEGIEEITEQTEPLITDIQNELEKLNSQLELRIQKAIDRGYYSSLHIIDKTNKNLEEISNRIKEKEAELAEKIEDKIISILLNIIEPGSGIAYTVFINQIPSEIRHDITTFLYNIDSESDNLDESKLAGYGVTTLYIGNPSENKVSAQFNNQLKNLKLPYFEGDKIIGKRTYSSGDIGIIAAIPEEKYWDENSLQKRWDEDRIRLYRTMIAGIDYEGLETAATWYNDQLELAKDFISTSISFAGGAIEEDIDIDDVFNVVKETVTDNPKSSIGFATIAQGWILTAISGLQEPDFEKVESLGYVVIIQKKGSSYRTLETYSIQGDKINSFIGDYEEIVEEALQETGEQGSKITGRVIEEQNQEQQDQKTDKDNFIVSFIKKIWGWIFG